jgi:hypothetical protein
VTRDAGLRAARLQGELDGMGGVKRKADENQLGGGGRGNGSLRGVAVWGRWRGFGVCGAEAATLRLLRQFHSNWTVVLFVARQLFC